MASISTDKKGLRRILFIGPDRKRRCIRLGRVTLKAAEQVRARVETLNSAEIHNQAVNEDTARWVACLDGAMADKLAAVGLIPQRERATLGPFIERYMTSRADVKPLTQKKYESTRRSLVKFFGADKRLRDISPGDADDWRMTFSAKGKSENTARKHVAVAKLFFGHAVKKRLISSNPFAHLKATIRPNKERFYFVTLDEARKVLEACPDDEWRGIFALARFGGLRTPSETLGLRWSDIDWAENKMRVRSPKTEHHEGKASRIVPLFPELRPYLDALWERAEPGAEFVITHYRDTNQNLRSRLLDIIWSAGLKEWPKLFQNLRSTRETELAERFPTHVVCEWLGNSEAVAAKHYLQVTDEHYRQAAAWAGNGEAAQKAAHETTHQPRVSQGVAILHGQRAAQFNLLQYCTAVQLAETGLEPVRG
ncbi:MAG: site-specific integrase [Thermoguttaceae bacterium]